MSNRKRILSCFLIAIMVMFCSLVSVEDGYAYSATDELEPNDLKTEANIITVGTTVYGESDHYDYVGGTGNGEDWFKFTAPVSGTAFITVYADSTTRTREHAAVDVYDSENNKLAEASDSMETDGGSTATFGVSSGKSYYIRAYGNYYNFFTPGVSYHFSTGYSIGPTSIKSLGRKKKAFSVAWNKKAKASFYQIQYTKKSVYDDYAWNKAKIIKVSNKSKSKTIKKLARNKKYCVRVRVARVIQGKTYYSRWSPKKIVWTR